MSYRNAEEVIVSFDDDTKILDIEFNKSKKVVPYGFLISKSHELNSLRFRLQRHNDGMLTGLYLTSLTFNLYIHFNCSDEGKYFLSAHSWARDSKLKQQLITAVERSNPTINNNILSYDLSDVFVIIKKIEDKAAAASKEERLKVEDRKFNTLFVAGKLELIGVPTKFATIENDGLQIKVKIPGAQESEKFVSYILIEVCKSKKKNVELDDNSKVNLWFLNEHINGIRKPKLVPFKNLTLSSAISIIESFKQVYFKDINNDNDIQ
jgi:hypothetical protein